MKAFKKALGIGMVSASLALLCASGVQAADSVRTDTVSFGTSGGVSDTGRNDIHIPLPPPANGTIVCAQGKLTKLERVWGSDNTIRVASESTPSQSGYRYVPGLGNMTEITFEAAATERGRDRIALLQTALAQKLPVQIVSGDYSCIGSQDKFDITLCTDANACSMPR